jgi:phosphocarrier protein
MHEAAVTSRDVTVVNPLGLHARAAARFVRLAGRFASQIRVTRGARTMDGKSILGLLLLAAARGSVLTIAAEGPDEVEAVAALCDLVGRGFEDA